MAIRSIYDKRCGQCDGVLRSLFANKATSLRAKRQHSRWHICENGHKVVLKVDGRRT